MPTDSVSREEFLELQKQLTSLVSKQAQPVVKNETKVWIEKDRPLSRCVTGRVLLGVEYNCVVRYKGK